MTDKRIRIVLDKAGAERGAKQLDKSMRDVGRGADQAQFSVNKLAAAIGAIVAGRQVIRFFQDSIKASGDFQQAMARVGAITRATDAELAALSETARHLGATTEFTAVQAASGLEFLGRAGFSAAQSIAALPAVLDLATAAQMDLGVAADVVSNIMGAFGISAENASVATDILAAASSRANTDVGQLGEAMKMAGPIANSLGVEIGDTAAAIGALSDLGIQGSMAGTGLRRVMSSLANATPAATKTLKSLGLSMSELNPQTNSLVDIVGRLRDANLSAADAFSIFGDRGAPAILALIENNPKLVELTAELRNVEGEAKRMADTFRDTLSGDVEALNSAFSGLQITIGDLFNEQARSSVQALTAAISATGENMETIIAVAEALAVVVGTRLAVAMAASAFALGQKAVAASRATITLNAYGQVVARTTVATNMLAAASRAGAGALALMGGPLGVLAIAAAGLIYYSTQAKRADELQIELAQSTDNLAAKYRALGEASKVVFVRDMVKEISASRKEAERLDGEVERIRERLTRVTSERGAAILTEQMENAAAAAEKARENTVRLIDALKTLRTGPTESAGVPTPTGTAQDPAETAAAPADISRELAGLTAGTDAMRRELALRRQVSDIFRSAELDAMASQFEQERAMLQAREQEQIANLEARSTDEQARRDFQFSQMIERMEIEEEQRVLLEAEHNEQRRLAQEILQEQITSVEAQGAKDREAIARREKDTKISLWQSMSSAGLQVLAAFGSQSFQSQKNFAIAEGIVNIAGGVAKALNNPYPANLGFAAQVAAQGAGLISTIRSTKPGSGAAPSVSSAAPSASVPTATPQQQPQAVTVRLEGLDAIPDDAIVSGSFVKQIGKRLESAWNDGVGEGRSVMAR